ncbi:MAG: metallophosphoesterase [bacterium]|nr:metallophosphoesterase [bacterium]
MKNFFITIAFLFLLTSSYGIDWNDNYYDYFKPWNSGNGKFGYLSDCNTIFSSKNITYYFKTSFLVLDPRDYSTLTLGIKYTDGFIAYINGREVLRVNIPEGEVNYDTLADSEVLQAEFAEYNISWFLDDCEREENNMIWEMAIEVHNYIQDDSNFYFDAWLITDKNTFIPSESQWSYWSEASEPEPIPSDPLTIIQRPVTGYPEIVKKGNKFNLLLRTESSDSGWELFADTKFNTYPLAYSDEGYDNERKIRILSVSTDNLPLFTYDLIVESTDGKHDRTENAFRVISEFRNRYQFIHMSDLHLPEHFYGYISIPDFESVLDNIDVINPEFIIITGDVTNRGDQEWAVEILQNMLRETELPVFIMAGNHDTGEWCGKGWARENWRKYFGLWYHDPESTENDGYYTEDLYFKYGSVYYIILEAYLNYSDFMTDYYEGKSLTDEQRLWLHNLVSEFSENIKFLFYHYDFDGTIDEFIGKKNVVAGFFGHTHASSIYEGLNYVKINTGSVTENREYRIVKIQNDNILNTSLQIGTILDFSFNLENNGTSNSITATVTNNSNYSLENCRLDFIMPETQFEYGCDGGEIIQTVETIDGSVIVSCEFDISPENSKRISVFEDKNIKPVIVNVKIYPNPVKNGVCFFEIDYKERYILQTEIEIYSISGELINTININSPGTYTWNLTNKNGKPISSGIYLLQIKTKGDNYSKTRIQKLAILH